MRTRQKSSELLKKLQATLPGGVNSPVRAFSGIGIQPLIVSSGKADEITDIDGHTYIDYNMAWGSLILGHVHPAVTKSTKAQIDQGSSFGMTTEIEYLWAQELKKCVPSIEKVRVVASGTEATMTAIRLARAYTHKTMIVKFDGHYHGHSDAFLVKAGSGLAHHLDGASSQGVPEGVIQYSLSLPFNNVEALKECFRKYGKEIAAVIVEPVAGNMGVIPSDPVFMQQLRKQTEDVRALLIFDEVITGFRLGLEGAQGFYSITPDLSTYSKIIGGGYPLGAVGGKAKIMDLLAPTGPVYQAGTLSGNPVALHGGYAVLQEVQKEGFYDALERKTKLLLDPIAEVVEKSSYPLCLHRVGSMFSLFFGVKQTSSFEDVLGTDRAMFNQFFIELFDKGIYLSPSPFEASFVSYAHTEEHLVYTQQAILSFLTHIEAKAAYAHA